MRIFLLRRQLLAASALLVLVTPATAAATALQCGNICGESSLWILSYSARSDAVEQFVGDDPFHFGGGAQISQPVNGESFSGDRLEAGEVGDLADIVLNLIQAPGYDGDVRLGSSVSVGPLAPPGNPYGSVAVTLQATLQLQTLVPITLRYGMDASQTVDAPPGDLMLDSTMSINVRNVTTGDEILALSCCSTGEVLIAAAAGDIIEVRLTESASGSATTGGGGSLSLRGGLDFAPIPEPSTASLLALGLAALAIRPRRRSSHARERGPR